MTLAETFQYHGTDKAELGYAPVYEMLFAHRRERVLSMLEVGVGTMTPGAPSSMAHIKEDYVPGASLRAWRDWFPYARVIGIDTQEDAMLRHERRITTYQCDSTSPQVREVLGSRQFDLIVDDGLHTTSAQIATLVQCWPLLRSSGAYVIEDVIGEFLFDNQDALTAVAGVPPVFIRCSTTYMVVLTRHPEKFPKA